MNDEQLFIVMRPDGQWLTEALKFFCNDFAFTDNPSHSQLMLTRAEIAAINPDYLEFARTLDEIEQEEEQRRGDK